jgi:DnaK suppressor protein
MNATVTKTAKKSIAGIASKKTNEVKAAAKTGLAARSTAKSTLKTVADKLAKTITKVLKPASDRDNAVVEPAREASMNKSKSAPGPATKSAAKVASDGSPTKASTMKVTPVASETVSGDAEKDADKTGTDLKQTIAQDSATIGNTKSRASQEAIVASKLESRSAQTVIPSRKDRTVDGLADDIEKTAVSKVSEVATKTTKSTPSVPTDGQLLSEAQILKMGDKDYMNAAQLAFFKARLQQLEKDLLKNAGETTEHLRETVLVPDPADRATIEEEHALELRTRDRERKLLKKVQQSIASIDSGEYGWCEETGEPIGIPRLLARPTATLSLEAQQRRELKQKLYGD